MPQLTQLPQAVLERIASFVPPEDCARMACAHASLQALPRNLDLLFTRPCLQPYRASKDPQPTTPCTTEALMARYGARLPEVRCLRLPDDVAAGRIMLAALPRFGGLQALYTEGHHLTAGQILSAAPPTLRKLSFDGSFEDLSDASLARLAELKDLAHLSLQGACQAADKELAFLAALSPQLQSLRLDIGEMASEQDDLLLDKLAALSWPKLISLGVRSRCSADRPHHAGMQRWLTTLVQRPLGAPYLAHLDLAHGGFSTHELIELLRPFSPQLLTLRLSMSVVHWSSAEVQAGPDSDTPEGRARLMTALGGLPYPQLQCLALLGASYEYEDSTVYAVNHFFDVAQLPVLRHLEIYEAPASFAGFLPGRLPCLKQLALTGDNRLSAEALVSLSEAAPRLERLMVDHDSDCLVASVLPHLPPTLRTLQLGGCYAFGLRAKLFSTVLQQLPAAVTHLKVNLEEDEMEKFVDLVARLPRSLRALDIEVDDHELSCQCRIGTSALLRWRLRKLRARAPGWLRLGIRIVDVDDPFDDGDEAVLRPRRPFVGFTSTQLGDARCAPASP
ncbi:MAG: hypothetical protein EOO40_01270, partial [Deltaproteobacteria bacterium]